MNNHISINNDCFHVSFEYMQWLLQQVTNSPHTSLNQIKEDTTNHLVMKISECNSIEDIQELLDSTKTNLTFITITQDALTKLNSDDRAILESTNQTSEEALLDFINDVKEHVDEYMNDNPLTKYVAAKHVRTMCSVLFENFMPEGITYTKGILEHTAIKVLYSQLNNYCYAKDRIADKEKFYEQTFRIVAEVANSLPKS